MSDDRRYFVEGGTFFITVVTARRAPLFESEQARTLVGEKMRACFARYPVTTIALVLLPEHLHALWALPPGDSAYF